MSGDHANSSLLGKSGAVNDLLRLAERCEKASGPDRMLDDAIYLHVRRTSIYSPGSPVLTPDTEYTPLYTSSIDAALTLVPDAHEWRAGVDLENRNAWAVVGDGVWDESCSEISAIAANPALALCAAALRARHALKSGDRTAVAQSKASA